MKQNTTPLRIPIATTVEKPQSQQHYHHNVCHARISVLRITIPVVLLTLTYALKIMPRSGVNTIMEWTIMSNTQSMLRSADSQTRSVLAVSNDDMNTTEGGKERGKESIDAPAEDDFRMPEWDWDRVNAIQPAERRPCPHTLPKFMDMAKNVTVYSRTRNDRSGCVIQHMLQVYAYTWKYGFTYGGGTTEVFSVLVRMRKRHEEMFRTIGLDNILGFNKPDEMEPNYFLFAGPRCYEDIRLDDPAFLEHLQSIQRTADLPELPQSLLPTTGSRSVAVHIRRGDANPCLGLAPRLKRYQPNAYYLKVLEAYVGDAPDVEVTIFSEKESFESFDEFTQLGYNLQLDGSMSEAWLAMMNADILITSPESIFSYIPAIFNRNTVYHDKPGFHWNVVSESTRSESDLIKERLIEERCPAFIKLHSCLEENKYPPYKDCHAEAEMERPSR